MGLLSAAFFAAEAFLPLLLTAIRGRSATVAGLALTAATVCWTAGAWIQARLASTRSRRAMVAAGLTLDRGGNSRGTGAVLSERVPVVVAALAWGVAGLGMGVAYSTTALVVLEMAPPGREGAASASMQLANVLGVALGTGFGGAIVALGTTAGAPFTPGHRHRGPRRDRNGGFCPGRGARTEKPVISYQCCPPGCAGSFGEKLSEQAPQAQA